MRERTPLISQIETDATAYKVYEEYKNAVYEYFYLVNGFCMNDGDIDVEHLIYDQWNLINNVDLAVKSISFDLNV